MKCIHFSTFLLVFLTIGYQKLTQSQELTSFCLFEKEDKECSVTGTFLEEYEEKRLLAICKDSTQLPLLMMTVRNGTISAEKTLAELCEKGKSGRFLWISRRQFSTELRSDVQISRGYRYLSRHVTNTDVDDVNSVKLIDFLSMDLTSGQGLVLSSKTVVNESDAQILVEQLPLSYDLTIVKRSAWKNVTAIDDVILGKGTLLNHLDTDKYVRKSFNYTFDETDQVVFGPAGLLGTPVHIHESGEPDTVTNLGEMTTRQKIYNYSVVQELPAHSFQRVILKGTLADVLVKIEGIIIAHFDKPLGITEHPFTLIRINRTIVDVVPEYEPVTRIRTAPNLTSTETPFLGSNESYYNNQYTKQPIDSGNGHPYPEFRKFFIVACFIFFGICIVVFSDVALKLLRARERKFL